MSVEEKLERLFDKNLLTASWSADAKRLMVGWVTKIFDESRPCGEWTIRKRYTKEGHDDGYGLYCSECNTHLITLSNRGLTLEEARKYLNDHIEKNKFCFNCGADMSGKKVKQNETV